MTCLDGDNLSVIRIICDICLETFKTALGIVMLPRCSDPQGKISLLVGTMFPGVPEVAHFNQSIGGTTQ